jgi:hypothetical protein
MSPTKVSGASTGNSPAVVGTPESSLVSVAFAWTTSTGHVDVKALSALGWAPTQTMPQALTDLGPAMALVNNDLFFAWKGTGTNTQVWYSDSQNYQGSGDTWAGQKTQPQAGTNVRPAIAANGSTLAAAWLGKTGNSIFYSLTTNPY